MDPCQGYEGFSLHFLAVAVFAIARKPCYGQGIKEFFDNIPHQLINLIEFY